MNRDVFRAGARNLITDVPGLRVGNAHDAVLKSGVTVLTADTPFVASYHVMGGAPGTRDTDLLAPDKSVAAVDALVLSGGSAFGLDACSGVVDGLRAAGRGFAVGSVKVPIVPGAILFDLLNGGAKDWTENPYSALGRKAFDAADARFALGTAGAGTGATTATLKGGLGSASLVLEGGLVVGALVAANPVGNVVTPLGRHFYAAPFELNREFGGLGADPAKDLSEATLQTKGHGQREGANTTIGIVATNAKLSKSECQRVAVAAHDGIARAVVPAHTPMDGDLIFAVSMADTSAEKTPQTLTAVGHAAALCLSRAIARAIYLAEPAANDPLPCWSENLAR